jgi:hypothetical protein
MALFSDLPFMNERAFFLPLLRANGHSKPNPAVFGQGLTYFNSLIWRCSDLAVNRLRCCGFVFSGDAMLISPSRVSQFFEVSLHFVNAQLERLGWDSMQLSPKDWSGALSSFPVGMIPEDFLTQRNVQIRIQKPGELLLREAAVTDQDLRDADTGADQEEVTLSNITDEECEDRLLKRTALSLTDDPELEALQTTLDRAITDIECVLVDPQPGLAAEASERSAPLDPRIPKLQASLRVMRAHLRKITANRNALQREFAQTWRIVHRKERENVRLMSLIPARQTPDPPQANPEGTEPGPEPPLEVRLLREMCALALCGALADIQYVDKIEESGPLAGHGITTRFKALRGPEDVPVCALEA